MTLSAHKQQTASGETPRQTKARICTKLVTELPRYPCKLRSPTATVGGSRLTSTLTSKSKIQRQSHHQPKSTARPTPTCISTSPQQCTGDLRPDRLDELWVILSLIQPRSVKEKSARHTHRHQSAAHLSQASIPVTDRAGGYAVESWTNDERLVNKHGNTLTVNQGALSSLHRRRHLRRKAPPTYHSFPQSTCKYQPTSKSTANSPPQQRHTSPNPTHQVNFLTFTPLNSNL